MSTTDSGRNAESRVADYLRSLSWQIVSQNWRNRWCEIDIVTQHNNKVFFVEVKYRAKSDWGDGFDVITPLKLDRMSRAAESWVQANNWNGEYQLVVAKVSNDDIELCEID